MRRVSFPATVIATLAAMLLLAAPAPASEPQVPFQTFALNKVEVPSGGMGTFTYFVQHPTATEASCSLVVTRAQGPKRVTVAKVPFGPCRVLNYWPSDPVASADMVVDTWKVGLKRGSCEWYISATVTVNGKQYTNTMYAGHILKVL